MFEYSARPDLLAGRIILVTGAGRGIGEAAAKAYAAHGATVLLLGKNEDNLNRVYDEIEAAGHPRPAVIPFNLETALPHQYDELAAMIERNSDTGRIAAQRCDRWPSHADRAVVRRQFHASHADQRECHVHADQHLATAAQALQRRLGDLHLQQRRTQRPRLLVPTPYRSSPRKD